MILSNKALLPILWEMAPGHPHLLPAFFEARPLEGQSYVRKPIYSREGANICIVNGDQQLESPGIYGQEGHVYQSFAALPAFSTGHPMVGVWMVGERACGLGIRQSKGLITDNRSQYVPHIIR